MHAAQITGGPRRTYHAAPPDPDLDARLKWLVAANAAADRRERLRLRRPRGEQEAMLMRRPVPTERAFARFGLLLGLLPPAAIFLRLALLSHFTGLFNLIFLPMLLVCALMGRRMGAHAGRTFDESERASRGRTLVDALEDAFIWAAATGGAGGAIFFGFGAVFGFACALPVAMLAFALFAPLHRLLARDGMIDARHLAPLAWGINLTISALILSPRLLPY
ncbi:MAG TPA: hypothetical protein VM864_01090 [Pyrinomonadaceae bacterium]|nr:hypothetical protein [Pyrinomonadaceae bacterium]